MDWQDELRRLDKQLSEGEISAQQYRRLRDELLAEASAPAQGKVSLWNSAHPDVAGPEAPTRPAPSPDAMTRPAPSPPPPDDVTRPAPAPPAAEAVTRPAPPPQPAPTPPDAEDTQVVADETVVVEDDTMVVEEETVASVTPSYPNEDPDEDPERTTTVAAENGAAPAAEPESGFVELEELEEPEEPAKEKVPTFPPRPSDTPPPPAPPLPRPAPWTGHQVIGEEVFRDAKPDSYARRAATTLMTLVIVLAVAAGAIWYFAFRSDDDAPAESQSASLPTSAEPTSQEQSPEPTPSEVPIPDNSPADLADAVGPLPGTADKNDGTISAELAGQLKLVSQEEVEVATDAGVTDVIFRGSTKGSVGNALLVFTTPDGNAALDLAKAEGKYLRQHGFAKGRELQSGLPVLERSDDSGTVYRVVYYTGRYTVRFGVAELDATPSDLRKELETVADTITAVLPPS